jgi:hypothetical protein
MQQPLYPILVGVTTVSVVTCKDIPSWYRFDGCNSPYDRLFENGYRRTPCYPIPDGLGARINLHRRDAILSMAYQHEIRNIA